MKERRLGLWGMAAAIFHKCIIFFPSVECRCFLNSAQGPKKGSDPIKLGFDLKPNCFDLVSTLFQRSLCFWSQLMLSNRRQNSSQIKGNLFVSTFIWALNNLTGLVISKPGRQSEWKRFSADSKKLPSRPCLRLGHRRKNQLKSRRRRFPRLAYPSAVWQHQFWQNLRDLFTVLLDPASDRRWEGKKICKFGKIHKAGASGVSQRTTIKHPPRHQKRHETV